MGLESPNEQPTKEQEGVLSKLRNKTKGLAKALVLTTALSVGADNFSSIAERNNSPEDISTAVQLVKNNTKEEQKHYEKMLVENPGVAITVCSVLIPRLRNPEVFFEIAARNEPLKAIIYADELKPLVNADKILQASAENLINSGKAGELIRSYHRYSDYPSADKILEMAAKPAAEQDPLFIFDNATYFVGKGYEQEVMDRAIVNQPPATINHANQSRSRLKEAPLWSGDSVGFFAKRHENDKVVEAALRRSSNPTVKIINDLAETNYSLDLKIKMSLLLQNFLDKKTTFQT